jgi:hypothetical protein
MIKLMAGEAGEIWLVVGERIGHDVGLTVLA